ncbi:hypothetical protein [Amycolatopsis sp. lyj-112]|uniref:hypothetical protein n=1 Tax=Amycolatopsis sp. lyj-112 TaxID=2789288 RepID=UPI003979F92A
MIAFLEQLGGKIVDRWLTRLLLPGLLWLSCAVVATQLGWAHAIDPHAVEPLAKSLAGQRSTAQAGLLIAAVSGGGAVAGLAAIGLAVVLRRAWTSPGRLVPARWLRQWRIRRWAAVNRAANQVRLDALNTIADSATTIGPEYSRALARRDSIGLEPPERPTWIGDRWFATGLRVRRAYGLDLTVVWPRLWTIVPETLRGDIAVAQLAYKEASTTVAWSVFYGVVGLFWGPALLIAAVIAVTGIRQARDATRNLCELVESACDLYGETLAERLRVPCPNPLGAETGQEINALLRRKDLPLT